LAPHYWVKYELFSKKTPMLIFKYPPEPRLWRGRVGGQKFLPPDPLLFARPRFPVAVPSKTVLPYEKLKRGG